MTVVLLLVGLAVALSLVMTLAWRIALRSGQSGWVDTIWSFAVGGAGFVAALVPLGAGSLSGRQWLVAGFCALWSLRLGGHIAARTKGAGDDPRYARLKIEWGSDFPRQLFWFLQIQAAAAFVLVIAIIAAAHNPADLPRAGDLIGLALLGIGIFGAALGDRQLTRFRADPANRGKVCDSGLWSWSRHPNYFFEWVGWISYPLVAIDLSGNYPWGWAALVGPAFIYWLLVHVSGIPLLEAHMLASRGAAFADYQRRVSAFWPWRPKS